MKYKNELIKQIKEELEFQKKENDKGDDYYNQASQYHTQFVLELNELADKYPNFIDVLLDKHIKEEDAIFGDDTTQYELTSYEKGRIYSLVRCKHMLRVAKEQLNEN